MNRIRIETKTGKIIRRRATVTDYINGYGEQSSRAVVGNHHYRVEKRDAEGAIFCALGK